MGEGIHLFAHFYYLHESSKEGYSDGPRVKELRAQITKIVF